MAMILVVDDNRDIAEALGALLQQSGYDVSVVYDGREALSRAAVDWPEAVLLDIGRMRRVRSGPSPIVIARFAANRGILPACRAWSSSDSAIETE